MRQDVYTAADFRRRAERAFQAEAHSPREFGDHSFNPELVEHFRRVKRRDAAVLVPVVDRPDGAMVILTQRTENLSSHAGQIAFPGGKVDAGESAEEAALREAEEEIGLPRSAVEVVLRAPDYLTGSGFRISPILAVVEPDVRLTLNPHEVADAFETPLAFLMDRANHRQNSRVWQGMRRNFFEMPWEDRYIWGVTAGIVKMLADELYGDTP
ncbi:CoA pyrophosphatase [Afifella sp. IM 167]|uniref:CoA pyrophosphatase n=1 Tax=Afifella sp. IM 167 TaxID=2033586 RepID=UPI001CC91BC7|nr:CoA pyrophosphatase [Afifella sp. IM 167]MBZ8134860.1 CoA pyrophosphatase [Afifella sp. IM 167]